MICKVPYQQALLRKGERRLHGHDDDEREEAEDINKAAAEAGNVRLVEEGADQITEGQDAQSVITEVKEKKKAIAVGKDMATFQHQGEDDDGKHKVGGTLQEPGKEVAEWVDAHHFHILWGRGRSKNTDCWMFCNVM